MHETNIANYTMHRGKVRDIYEFGENLLIIVTTDRISAFDWILPSIIPDKGVVLTQLSKHWADILEVHYHLVSTDLSRLPVEFHLPELEGRTMLVERAEVIPFECVVRGYLCGSAWKDYQKTGSVCGISLPSGLKQNQQFPKPLFTPATKATDGHDENISVEYMASQIGMETTAELEARSIELYTEAAEHCWQNNLILADTKLEWGFMRQASDDLVLIDEIFTPDSSRFWASDAYELGISMPSFDKQFVRDWLEESGWDKNSPPPALPEGIVTKTREKYFEAYERVVGSPLTIGDGENGVGTGDLG